MNVVRLLGFGGAAGSATTSPPATPSLPKMDGTSRLEVYGNSGGSSAIRIAAGLPGGGGGGGTEATGSATTVAVCAPTASNSGVETLSFGSSAGALLHPKMVQPPFSA